MDHGDHERGGRHHRKLFRPAHTSGRKMTGDSKSVEEWQATSGLSNELLDQAELASSNGNGWVRIATLGYDRAKDHLYAFMGENSIVSALLLSVTIPLTVQTDDCLSDDSIVSRCYALLMSSALALYMFAIAVTGVFNCAIASATRESDLLRLLINFDRVPGLPTFAISIANYLVIAAVTCAFYNCYHFSNDSFIYMSINLICACTSLLLNRYMRRVSHVTTIPHEEFQ
eukprot:gene7933-10026_t